MIWAASSGGTLIQAPTLEVCPSPSCGPFSSSKTKLFVHDRQAWGQSKVEMAALKIYCIIGLYKWLIIAFSLADLRLPSQALKALHRFK